MPWVPVELGAGRPVRIRVADLPEPLRTRYQAEGIRSELAAPIMIEGKWVGTIGFSDFWREGTWTDLETEALTTAADMVAGAWERDRAREGLQELAEAKDRFIAAVSHELRTPLSAVVGFSAALRDAAGSFSAEEIAEMAGMISAQSREVADLVDDLLTAERAASGNLTITTAPTDLEAELKSVVDMLPEPLPIDVNTAALVMADGLRTRQIIRNLLTNATRYGGPNVKIEIDVHEDMGRLTVMDDGMGVLGIDEDKIFDPYYRSRTDIAQPDSVGLGLAVARQLARLMSGDLVYRRQDSWTRFELRLPLAPDSPTESPQVPDPMALWETDADHPGSPVRPGDRRGLCLERGLLPSPLRQVGVPHQAGGGGAMGTPPLPQVQQRDRIGSYLEAEHFARRHLQGSVEDRPHVGSSQTREQIDVGGPRSDPDEPDQLPAHLIVVPRFQIGKIDSPVLDRPGQLSDVSGLLAREAVGP